jgi:probable FeS assembly SUF system protein SufT
MMGSNHYASIELTREYEATVIPGGEKMRLKQGEHVFVTQTLGSSFTLQTESGYLVRISAEDSASLGLAGMQTGVATQEDVPFDLDQVIAQLKNVFDPEIPINVVDLGLIYLCQAHPLEDGSQRVEIKMSMTAPGCGMGDILKEDARSAAASVPGVSEVDIELVWDPIWGRERMSDAALLQLGMYG